LWVEWIVEWDGSGEGVGVMEKGRVNWACLCERKREMEFLLYTPKVANCWCVCCVSVRLSITVTWEKQFKRRIYFGSWFQRFQLIVSGSVDSGPLVRKNITVAGACARGCSPLCTCSQEAEKGMQEGARPRHSAQGHDPNDLLPPTRPHLCFSLPPNNFIILWILQGINLLIRSETLWSSHSPKAHQLETKPYACACRGHFMSAWQECLCACGARACGWGRGRRRKCLHLSRNAQWYWKLLILHEHLLCAPQDTLNKSPVK
jgi:hypothetical protein